MREAARRIGVPETTYREWEYGRAIRGEPYVKIALAFGVTLDALLGTSDKSDITVEDRLNCIRQQLSIIQDEVRRGKK